MEMMQWLKEIVNIRTWCPPHEATFDLKEGMVVCGEFVEIEKEGFIERLQKLREDVKARNS